MEHAIAITRSQLRQVIEDYIAASRVGDTLSYVETARLSTAEAAESSTERLWAALEALTRNTLPVEPEVPEIRQVLYALDRQIAALTTQSDDLARARDYSAEFPAADAEALQQARRIVIASAGAAELTAEQALEQIEQFSQAEEFTCAEDLAAGQVVIVNSRGMIEGKRDEADNLVHQVAQPADESPDDFF